MIIIDTREPQEEVRFFKTRNISFIQKALPCGDYKIETNEGSVVIERKEIQDFLLSLFSGRLEDQLSRLSKEQNAFIVVSGNISDEELRNRNITRSVIYGAISSCLVRYGVSVLWIDDEIDPHTKALEVISNMLQKIEQGKLNKIKDKIVKDINYKRGAIKILFNIPSNVAEELLKKFGSVWGVLNASDDEILSVKGMGKKRLEKSKETLRGVYA